MPRDAVLLCYTNVSFGSTTGCLACAVNLVNFWCALICSPDQGSFVSIHDPPYAEASTKCKNKSSGGWFRVKDQAYAHHAHTYLVPAI